MPTIAHPPPVSRRRLLLGVLAGAAVLTTTSCATGAGKPRTPAPLSDTVPPGTTLSIAVRPTEFKLRGLGELDKLPFKVSEWPDLHAGPDVIEGFRGNAVDVASNAGIPPIQAAATGLDTKIVAVRWKTQSVYEFATRPGAGIRALPDLKGKKIAYSAGQAQGTVVLRTLAELDLTKDDVRLIELQSTQFLTALQSGQVDVAPLGGVDLFKFLSQYAKDGAGSVKMNAVDALTVLWSPTAVLADPAKAAAIKAFIPFWARGEVWAYENKDAFADAYYVKDQGLSPQDARLAEADDEKPDFPADWDAAVEWEQETIDLITGLGDLGGRSFGAEQLFDRRFEKIAADAVSAEYSGGTS